jgi:hypothetical protein
MNTRDPETHIAIEIMRAHVHSGRMCELTARDLTALHGFDAERARVLARAAFMWWSDTYGV